MVICFPSSIVLKLLCCMYIFDVWFIDSKLYNYLFSPFIWWLISSTIMMQSFAQHSPFCALFVVGFGI